MWKSSTTEDRCRSLVFRAVSFKKVHATDCSVREQIGYQRIVHLGVPWTKCLPVCPVGSSIRIFWLSFLDLASQPVGGVGSTKLGPSESLRQREFFKNVLRARSADCINLCNRAAQCKCLWDWWRFTVHGWQRIRRHVPLFDLRIITYHRQAKNAGKK